MKRKSTFVIFFEIKGTDDLEAQQLDSQIVKMLKSCMVVSNSLFHCRTNNNYDDNYDDDDHHYYYG